MVGSFFGASGMVADGGRCLVYGGVCRERNKKVREGEKDCGSGCGEKRTSMV